MSKSLKKEREVFKSDYIGDMGFNKGIGNTIPNTRNSYLENLVKETLKRAENQKKSETGNRYVRTSFWLKKHNYHPNGEHTTNVNTLKYHEPHCNDIQKMNEENKIETNNTSGLYSPCSHCKPHLKKNIKKIIQDLKKIR